MLTYTDSLDPYIVAGKMIGTVQWLNRSKPDEPFIKAGLWKHLLNDNSNNEFYCCYCNHSMMFYVLEGEAEFCLSDGKTIPIRKDNILFFPKDLEGVWRTLTPFAKLFIQVNSSQKNFYPNSLSFRTLIKQLANHKTLDI